MKVAIVYPRYRYPSGDPPLGVASLTAALKKEGIEPDVLDPTFERNPRSWLLDKLAERPYDMVGISAMITQVSDALEVARTVKFYHPYTKIIIGGPQSTIMPEKTLEEKAVDAVCVGEGEAAIREIVRNKLNLNDIPGIWQRKNGEIIKPLSCDPLDLDTLPFPDFSGLPMGKYLGNWFQLDSVAPNLRGLPIIASRGCPYHCSYCQPTLERIFGRKLRKRSPENIVEELRLRIKEFGINAFLFVDDTFPADRNWAISVCDAIEKANLGLVWGANIRADLAEKELLAAMKRAGLRKIFVGIESASERVIKEIYHKGIKLEQVKNTVAIAKELGLMVQGYFMLGAPTETTAEIESTIALARELPIEDAVFNMTTPLPGTALFDNYHDKIASNVEDMDYYRVYPWKSDGGISQSKLAMYRMKAYLSFYSSGARRKRLLKQIVSPSGLKRTIMKLKRVI